MEIRTDSGVIRGEALGGLGVFRGIPFAAAPFGANRFRPPQPVQPWNGVRDALEFGPGCPQPMLNPDPVSAGFTGPATTGEDCLNLNVWTPAPGATGLPVMVWIHGGGYVAGSGSSPCHDGAAFARDSVVYVSVNYRLGIEGFLYLGEGTGNLGLLDHVAALEWVQRNIAAFGGDPGNVTVFGESGGAVSVMHLLALPAAQGLFRRAIAQSGSSRATVTIEEAEAVAQRVGELVGVEPTADNLRGLPADTTVAVATAMVMEFADSRQWGDRTFMISPFAAVQDGETLPELIVPAVAGGASASVDLMAGTCRDEATGFLLVQQQLGLVDAGWAERARRAFGLKSLEAYAGRGNELEQLAAAWSDWAFRNPTLRLLEAHVPQPGRTYCYEFTWPSAGLPALGATHALEMAFVFDLLDETRKASAPGLNVLGDEPPQALADAMHGAWISFATHGDPGWPAYDLERRCTMRFDVTSGPVDDLA